MNVLILTYQGDVAGATQSISYLATGLSAHGHNIYVGCRKESLLYTQLEHSDVVLIPMTFRSKIDRNNIRQIRDAVHQYEIDVINAQSSRDRYSSILARWWYGLPVKVVHTRRQISRSIGGLQSLFYQWGTDKVIAVSDEVKRSLYRKGLSRDHIEVIYNGTPAEKYQRIEETLVADLRAKFSLQPGDFVIGCVSREKQQEQLLRAVAGIDFTVKVLFLGVDLLESYRHILDTIPQRHEIHFLGTVSPEETLAYYQLFDVKVLASDMEGLSQALLEAMFLKVPVIATAKAGNLDLITHESDGLLFTDGHINDLQQCIEKLYYDPSHGHQLAEAGHLTARKFTVEKTVSRHEELFYNLLSLQESQLVISSAPDTSP